MIYCKSQLRKLYYNRLLLNINYNILNSLFKVQYHQLTNQNLKQYKYKAHLQCNKFCQEGIVLA